MTSSIHHYIDDPSHCIFGELAELPYLIQGQGHDAVERFEQGDVPHFLGTGVKKGAQGPLIVVHPLLEREEAVADQ